MCLGVLCVFNPDHVECPRYGFLLVVIGMIEIAQGAFSNGLQGYQEASNQLQNAASTLARGNRQNTDITDAAVSMQRSSLQAQASAEVIRRADGMVGTIIDIFA
jgi:hypothetical protein